MAKTQTKQQEGIDILEDPDVLASKAEQFFDNKKNRNLVFGIGGVLAALILGFLAYKYYITNRDKEAQQELYQAVYYFEADSLGRALNGDGINYGFLQIAEDYSGTEAANLANYYSGVSYLKMGDFQSAIRYLSDFSSSDYLVQARAYSLIGDANMELGNYSEAANFYEQAADYKPNAEFTPIYLQKLAVALEKDGKPGAAAEAYGRIVSEFKKSTLFQEAEKQKARLEGLAAG